MQLSENQKNEASSEIMTLIREMREKMERIEKKWSVDDKFKLSLKINYCSVDRTHKYEVSFTDLESL